MHIERGPQSSHASGMAPTHHVRGTRWDLKHSGELPGGDQKLFHHLERLQVPPFVSYNGKP